MLIGHPGAQRGLALAFAAVTAFYSGLWMYAVRSRPSVRIGIEFEAGLDQSAIRVTRLAPGGPAERAGLRVGDRILAIAGQRPESTEPFLRTLARARPGDPMRLTVESEGAPPREIEVVLAALPPEPRGLTRRIADEVLASYPVLFLLVTVGVLLLRPDDADAWRLALVFASFIAAAPSVEPVFGGGLRGFAAAYKLLFDGLSPALFLWFFFVFPASSALDRRAPWLKWLWLVPGLLVSLPLAAWSLAAPGSAPAVGWVRGLSIPLRGPLIFYYFGGFSLGIVSLLQNALAAPGEVRRKSRVILWGTLLGFTPTLLLFAAATYLRRGVYEFPFPVWASCIVSLLLLPLSFAYAVVRHRVLELPVLLRRGVRYLLVQRGSLGLLLLLGVAATGSFAEALGGSLGPERQSAAIGVGAGFGTLLVWAGARVQKRLSLRIDRAFFRSAYDARLILHDLAERARGATGREDLAALIEPHVTSALSPTWLAIYLESDAGALRLVRATLALVPPSLDPSLPGLAELLRRGHPREVVPGSELGPLAAVGPDVLVPMLGRDGRLAGLLALGPRLSDEPYAGEDLRLLASVASQVGLTLESIRLAEQIAARLGAERSAAHEMELAQRVQARLLPQAPPHLDSLDCAGRCVQARAVGGDYYDFLEIGPGRVGLALADVSGKGLPAALLMASLQASLRSRSGADFQDVPRLLAAVNQLLYRSSEANRFATLFLGLYDDSVRCLAYANCGHNPPLLLRADGSIERLDATAPVLGLIEEWECGTGEVQLRSGDLLVVFSDGVTEAWSDTGEEFGEARLVELLRSCHGIEAATVLARVLERVRVFSGSEQEDDQTLVVARVR